jgi:hypothetical protein
MHVVVIQRASSDERAAEIFQTVFPGASVPAPQGVFEIVGNGDYQEHRREIIDAFERAAPDEAWRHWIVTQAQN